MVIFFKIQKRDEKPAGHDLISRYCTKLIKYYFNHSLSYRYHNVSGVPCWTLVWTKFWVNIITMNKFSLFTCLALQNLVIFSCLFFKALIFRAHFRDVLHTGLGMTDAYMMERVMVALDRGTSPFVTMATFAKALSLYLRGDLEERITYAFTVSPLCEVKLKVKRITYRPLNKSER